MRNIIVDGRIGSEFKKHTSQNGSSYLTFSLAVSVPENGEFKTEWMSFTDFNLADAEKFNVGDYVLVQAKNFRVSVNEGEKDGKKVCYLNEYGTVSQIDMLFKKKKDTEAQPSVYTSDASKRIQTAQPAVTEAKVTSPTPAPAAVQPAATMPVARPAVAAAPTPAPAPAPQPAFAMAAPDDDLPF